MLAHSVEPRGLSTSIFKYEVVCFIIAQKRGCDDMVSVQMLSRNHIVKRFVDPLKFRIESTLVKCDFFDDLTALDIIVRSIKL